MTNYNRSGTRLTDLKLKNIAAGSKALTHAALPGLLFIPSKSTKGVGTWYIRYTHPTTNKRIKLKIGRYPRMGLAQAEDEARRLFAQVDEGNDPKGVLQSERLVEKEKKVLTFEALTRQFYQRQLDANVWKNKRYIEQWIREMENHVFPVIGSMQINDIKALYIVNSLEGVWHRIPDTAKKLMDRIGQVFTYSEALGYCEHNPSPAAKLALGKQKRKILDEAHFPAMSWQDVPGFVEEVIFNKSSGQARWALLFLILNAARSGAVRNLAYSEIDFVTKIWTMEADAPERKTSVTCYYPLSVQSINLLLSQSQNKHPSGLVFPANKIKKDGLWVISDMTLSKIIKIHGANYQSDIQGKLPTVHGFRTCFKGWAVNQQYDDRLSELQLAHSVGTRTTRAYDRDKLIDSRRVMMQAWADYVWPLDSNFNHY